MERLQLLCTIAELYVPAFVSPNELEDIVDDIDTMSEWYYMITELGWCFGVPALIIESLYLFFDSTK